MKRVTLDARQQLFKELYLSPKSPTFGNAFQSALKAGYSRSTADSITTFRDGWVGEVIGDRERLRGAERVLSYYTDKNPEEFDDINVKRIQLDASKFVAKGLGREKYSERVEHVGDINTTLDLAGLFDQVTTSTARVIDVQDKNVDDMPELVSHSEEEDA